MADTLPKLDERDLKVALLKEQKNEDGSRTYSDEQISSFSDELLDEVVKGAKLELYKKSFREQNKTIEDRIAGNPPWDTQPELSETEIGDLKNEILDEQQIEERAQEVLDNEPEGVPEPDTSKEDAEEEGAGRGLTIQQKIEQREPKGPPEEIMELVRPQIDPSIDLEKYRPPPLVPISSLQILDMFIEPISRKMFVVLYFNAVGFFYFCVNVPCGYPLILPMPYPVSQVGKAPAGAITLAFMDPDLPDCFGTQPADISTYIEPGFDLSGLTAAIQPCDPNLEPDQLAACQEALKQQGRAILGDLPVPPVLQELLDLIKERSIVPVEETVVPSRPLTEEEVRIVQEGGEPADFEFVLKLGSEGDIEFDIDT